MRSYFTIESIIFCENTHENFVENIYQSFFKRDFKFLKPFSENNYELQLSEIIEHNQLKINNIYENNDKFIQILLDNKNYDEIRLFLDYENNYLFIDMIIPEDNIFEWENNKALFHKDKLNELINLSIGLWQENDIDLIHTQWEIEPYDNQAEVGLVFNPFGIMKNESFDDFENKKRYNVFKELEDAKVLIIKDINYK